MSPVEWRNVGEMSLTQATEEYVYTRRRKEEITFTFNKLGSLMAQEVYITNIQ